MRARRRDEGAAVVDFVLVGGLLTLLFAALLQLAVVLHVRNTLTDVAGEAARYGALADVDDAAAADRARALVKAEFPDGFAPDVTAGTDRTDGLATVVVRIDAPLPLVGLFGPGRTLHLVGHAVAEGE